ncbi:SulP family inorganic anion transporter [Derxia gummosa]|uniref:SulP family inorganic anion transporter n=1 Tax=Derxia gummosa DSM 723 TaxID=1121388 RepID=A0A8B6X8A0_9BURK|nr:SulP family inorganic anion transporter [Derxia gummosa]
MPSPVPAPPLPSWRDLAAGLCVAGLLIPEAVAYAGLARLPVGHALAATLAGLLVYGLAGGSRFAVVSPTSSSAALSAVAVLSLTAGAPDGDFAQALAALVLLAGAALALLGIARQGQLSGFVSRPVLRGFSFALAVSISVRQLPDALGLPLPHDAGADPLRTLLYTLGHGALWHGPSLAIALGTAALIALLRRLPRLPGMLIAMLAAIAVSEALGLPARGVEVVGAIAPPRFAPALPALDHEQWLRAAELAFGLVVLLFAESWGSIRGLALAHDDSVDADRELRALGLCNLVSGLVQGMAVGAGFSASNASAAAGAQSRATGLVAAAAVLGATLFALPLVALLPRPVLAVAVMGALWHALSPAPLLAVWRTRRDRALVAGAVAAVLALGVLHGMLAAVGLSLVAALRRFSQPVVHELGRLGGTRNYVVLDAHVDAHALPGLLILRPEEPLFFASAERVVNEVAARARARPGLRHVVLSLEESSDLDSTAVECLRELRQRLARDGHGLILARAKDRVRALLARCDPEGVGRADHMTFSVADAVRVARGNREPAE